MDNERIIEKIKGLLALGDKSRNCEDAEAQAAMLKAQELMAKYNISVEMTEEEKISYTHEVCDSKWNMGFRKPLARVIANNFRCTHYLRGSGGAIVFFGHANDARIAKEVFEFAYAFAMKEGNRCYNKCYQMGRETRGVFNSYVQGFIKGLEQKLGEQSMALMIVTPQDVKDEFQELSKNWKTSAGGMRNTGFDREAYSQGVTDGRTVMNGRRLDSK